MMNEFDEFLKSKKIDAAVFKKKNAQQYNEFERLFLQMHPASFTAQKLFLINGIRREFPLKEEELAEKSVSKVKIKPKITPRIKK